jgi:serine/threonine protein kinase
VLQDRFEPGSDAARRFAEEARVTASLQYPGIPPVHNVGVLAGGRPYVAMKLIQGQTLDLLLACRPEPGHDRGRFVAAFEQLCQAVGYAHSKGVLHRDFKPANVMGAFGEVQRMDWGLAKVLASWERERPEEAPQATTGGTPGVLLREGDEGKTQADSVPGTPAFMPPEQAARLVHKLGRRRDVFGLGAVLAVILTGKPPFVAGSSETARGMAVLGELAGCFTRLDAYGADPELVALCKRRLSPRQDDRPADAGEVAAADERARRQAERRMRRRLTRAAVVVAGAGGGRRLPRRPRLAGSS